jgi:hypothetical protein
MLYTSIHTALCNILNLKYRGCCYILNFCIAHRGNSRQRDHHCGSCSNDRNREKGIRIIASHLITWSHSQCISKCQKGGVERLGTFRAKQSSQQITYSQPSTAHRGNNRQKRSSWPFIKIYFTIWCNMLLIWAAHSDYI